jgi:cobalt-zinc-cadmium resistance protein CzcA
MPELIGYLLADFKTNVGSQDSFNGMFSQFGVAVPLFNSATNNKKNIKIHQNS